MKARASGQVRDAKPNKAKSLLKLKLIPVYFVILLAFMAPVIKPGKTTLLWSELLFSLFGVLTWHFAPRLALGEAWIWRGKANSLGVTGSNIGYRVGGLFWYASGIVLYWVTLNM